MDLVGVSAVVHGGVAKHAFQGDIDQVGGLLGLGLGLCVCLGMLVDVGHGGDGAAAGARAGEGGDGGRARGGLGDERRAAGVHAAIGGCGGGGGAGSGGRSKGTRAVGGLGGRLWTRRAGLRVEQDGPVAALGLVLGDQNAAVARKLQVDLGQRPVVGGPQREGGAMQRVGLAVRVAEGARLGIQQVARVRLFGGRVEGGGGVVVVGGVGLGALAKELAEHVSYRAHRAMGGVGNASQQRCGTPWEEAWRTTRGRGLPMADARVAVCLRVRVTVGEASRVCGWGAQWSSGALEQDSRRGLRVACGVRRAARIGGATKRGVRGVEWISTVDRTTLSYTMAVSPR